MQVWLKRLRAWKRRVDVAIFWPICVAKARTLEEARIAFALHAAMDPAWTCDYDLHAIAEIINQLEPRT